MNASRGHEGISAEGPAPDGWPEWIGRRFHVAPLGTPGVFLARVGICFAFVMVAYVGAWNAQHYPIALGYDATGHIAYANVLIHDHRLPTAADTNEYHQPPGYYALAGEATRFGEYAFGFPPGLYRGAQYLNLLFVLATAGILLALARTIAPDRPSVWAAAMLFFAFLPVVSKTEAMFQPETLNMLLSSAALLLTTRVLKRGHLGLRAGLSLGLLFAAGLLVRSSTLFTILTVGVSLAIVFLVPKIRSRVSLRRTGLTLGIVAVLVVGGVELYRSDVIPSTPDLGLAIRHPLAHESPISSRSSFFHLSTQAFTVPFRPNYVNQAFTTTYTEIWGDWLGAFSWSAYSITPPTQALTLMKDQSWIGIIPTFLAILGWLLLVGRTLRRRPMLLAIALLPVFAGAGYLYRSYLFLTSDGDLFKASYVLTTAPVWALGFGVAFGTLKRFPMLRAGVAVCLLIFAILELRFTLYGIRDHRVIF